MLFFSYAINVRLMCDWCAIDVQTTFYDIYVWIAYFKKMLIYAFDVQLMCLRYANILDILIAHYLHMICIWIAYTFKCFYFVLFAYELHIICIHSNAPAFSFAYYLHIIYTWIAYVFYFILEKSVVSISIQYAYHSHIICTLIAYNTHISRTSFAH